MPVSWKIAGYIAWGCRSTGSIGRQRVARNSDNQGAIERTVEMICERLQDTELFVEPDPP